MARRETDFGKWKTRMSRQAERERARQRVAPARERVRQAKAAKRAALRAVVARGKAIRQRMRRRWTQIRAAARARVNAQIETERAQMRARHKRRKDRLRAEHTDKIKLAEALLRQAREDERELRQFERGTTTKAKARRTAIEALQESDSEVINNLGMTPELIPVFRKVKHLIKSRPRMTRTEAFAHWVEENPEEVITIRADSAEVEIAQMVAEYDQAMAALEREEAARDIAKAGAALGLGPEASALEDEMAALFG